MLSKSLVWCLVIAMSFLSVVPRAEGSFAPSEDINLDDAQRATDIEKIQTVLEEKLISQKLEDLGFSSQEIKGRLYRLSNDQIHNYAQKLDELRAGGFHQNVNILIVILLILIIVLLIVSVDKNAQDYTA